jgi:predicted amidohydrolase
MLPMIAGPATLHRRLRLRQTGVVRVSLVQLAAGTDVTANLEQAAELVRQSKAVEPDLVMLPEAVMHDFGDGELTLGPVAQPLDGPFVAGLAGMAREARATIVAGMFETSPDPDRPHNTLVAVGPDGDVQAMYRKAHLYDSFGYRESDRLLAGEPVPVVMPLAEVTLGLMTCYDLRFPEFSRALVNAGADVLAVPAAWVRGPLKEDHWSTLLRARAIENTVYVVAAAQNGRRYCGCSMVVDPMGVVVTALGEQTGTTSAEVSAQRITDVRRRNPSLDNRRLGLGGA